MGISWERARSAFGGQRTAGAAARRRERAIDRGGGESLQLTSRARHPTNQHGEIRRLAHSFGRRPSEAPASNLCCQARRLLQRRDPAPRRRPLLAPGRGTQRRAINQKPMGKTIGKPAKAEVVSSDLAGCAIVSVRVHGCPEVLPGEGKLAVYEFRPRVWPSARFLATYRG